MAATHKSVGVKSAQSFVKYLRETLIPDLRESGREFTADDFERACGHIEWLVSQLDDGRSLPARNELERVSGRRKGE